MKTPHGDLDSWPDPAGADARRSVFAQDLVVEGVTTSGSQVAVHGKFIFMRAPDIVIPSSGRVEGAVVANDLSVLGAVSGKVSARNVRLAPSAVVHADISH